jgi:hypothetical protein
VQVFAGREGVLPNTEQKIDYQQWRRPQQERCVLKFQRTVCSKQLPVCLIFE